MAYITFIIASQCRIYHHLYFIIRRCYYRLPANRSVLRVAAAMLLYDGPPWQQQFFKQTGNIIWSSAHFITPPVTISDIIDAAEAWQSLERHPTIGFH